ncbi:hypothetical protein P3875_04105 [Myroides sp. JBRI-B21084]|uniref:hypothetical protein n=1 Tax=Myroides sp. JBRI-B21084 TaxID=3119977 RepID=UPI0026E373F3|nr:hypothetical protein [Paenimyroides cloacae]WKW47255.1 hypothetical protein P3875_04105 [Paenimyroides cloacae]
MADFSFFKEQMGFPIVGSITGPQVNNTDPENPILPEFALPDGSNTVGGLWFIDKILSDNLPVYKKVFEVLATKALEYGNIEINTHRFIVETANGLKLKVGNNEYTLWNQGNFNPDNKANIDGSNVVALSTWNIISEKVNNIADTPLSNINSISTLSSNLDSVFGRATNGFLYKFDATALSDFIGFQSKANINGSNVVALSTWNIIAEKVMNIADMPVVNANGVMPTLSSNLTEVLGRATNGALYKFDATALISFLGINTSWNLQQVTNNGRYTTLNLGAKGLLSSDYQSDEILIPTNGIYSKGQISTGSHGTSADWNAKVSNLDNATGIGFANGSFSGLPYFFHPTNGQKFLATIEYINSQNYASIVYVDQQIANIPTPGNGTVVLQGVGSITGAVTFSLDQSNNAIGTFDLTSSEKSNIQAGKDAFNQLQNLFGGLDIPFKNVDVSGGGSVDPKGTFFNLINPKGNSVAVTIDDHDVHGARLVLRGTGPTSGTVSYTLNAINDLYDPISMPLQLGENTGIEFTWDSNEGAWVITGI